MSDLSDAKGRANQDVAVALVVAEIPRKPSPRDFDWRDNDTIVLQEPTTAIYTNPHGGIVIRQEDEDDSFVFNSEEAARRVVAAKLRELGDRE